ncbi:MAG: prepilin peptidase [Candidatus Sungbacteria bacterium]|nr:prepilin peptidase [Candidatus Sungbacteria bacterium]
MDIMFAMGIILLGLAAGSFLNVIVFRLGSSESILWGRSHCVSCKHVLQWSELIPVLSFLVLGGKCRSCHESISWRYPIVELLTAGSFFLTYLRYKEVLFLNFPFSPFLSSSYTEVSFAFGLVFYLVIVFLLIGIAVYDWRTFIIAPALMIPFFALSAAGVFFGWLLGQPLADASWTIVTAAAVFFFFFAIFYFSKGRALGFGDAELAPTIVLFLGAAKGAVALLLSFWIGAVVGVSLIIFGAAKMKSKIPFGPFLAAGALLALWWGDALIWNYLNI